MKTIVMTGATSGIGLETAKLLAKDGFRVLGVGRDDARCKLAAQIIRAAVPQAEITFFTTNLMQQREVHCAASALTVFIGKNCDGKLYALLNNAGCARGYYMTTEDSYEQQFALNYLAGFLLTYRLFPLLQKAGGRVIMTGSQSHKGIRVHWDDVMLTKRYNPLTAYKQSKLCDILFAKGLNDRCVKQNVHAYTVDPGLVRTEIGNKGAGGLVSAVWSLRKLSGVSPEIPAQTYAFLCNQVQAPKGLYYKQCRERAYSREVTTENADRLFALSERLCGISYDEVCRI
ncbi:SDR family NAD(P)-dependent oxidoreductase [Yeguia hominis]|uniref:SDR family NAD(P)-dependent oxidoreductase n=1 Tax=Yeguia hominis TaxID=2763662 RepID=A0A926DB41_9FIRM|nr:SDR family NAD(P)-dependent oxidoreductase [Yeguia hominis]MBC8533715.1 SDR family NAD(P)-dependent oxidoreductase [Yeguia hominis]